MSVMNLLKPVVLFESLFDRKLRLDDKKPSDFLPFEISTNVLTQTSGSSLVRLGATEVICGVKVKVLPEVAGCGRVICNVEFGPLSSQELKLRNVTRRAQCVTSTLQRIVDSIVCPTAAQQLSILGGRSAEGELLVVGCYVIHADMLVLYDDGCVLDACLPACLAALASARWPKLQSKEKEKQEVTRLHNFEQVGTHETMQLILDDWPVSISFASVPAPSENSEPAALLFQPRRRELSIWDIDGCPGNLIMNSSGAIVNLTWSSLLLSTLYCDKQEGYADTVLKAASKQAELIRGLVKASL